ncbi:MAG: TIGR00725 family protein [Acidimicrobiales bacterium]
MTTYVAVCGAGEATPAEVEVAEAVGRGLAGAGAVVVCGGLGGVMEAACRGARRAGGITVGILPGDDRSTANPYLTVALPTGLGELRNGLVVRAADAVIAVGGGYGTLSEIALALKTRVPVVGLDTWGPSRGGRPVGGVVTAADPDGAVARALRLAGGR